MKNLHSFFVLFLLFFGTRSSAQLSVSPMAGVNITGAHFSFPDYLNHNLSTATHFFAGATVQYDFGEKFSVGEGIQYTEHGYTESADIFPSIKYSYINISTTFEYKPVHMIGLFGGLSAGVKTWEKIKSQDRWVNPVAYTIRKTDLGAVVGIKLYCKNIFFTAQYFNSIINVTDNVYVDGVDLPIYVKQYNQSLQIGLGYKIDIRKKQKT